MFASKIFRVAIIAVAITVGSVSVPQQGICGVVRDDGSICQRLSGGKKDCDELGGKWDSKKNCCEINGIGG